jgi:hypothetical protein
MDDNFLKENFILLTTNLQNIYNLTINWLNINDIDILRKENKYIHSIYQKSSPDNSYILEFTFSEIDGGINVYMNIKPKDTSYHFGYHYFLNILLDYLKFLSKNNVNGSNEIMKKYMDEEYEKYKMKLDKTYNKTTIIFTLFLFIIFIWFLYVISAPKYVFIMLIVSYYFIIKKFMIKPV